MNGRKALLPELLELHALLQIELGGSYCEKIKCDVVVEAFIQRHCPSIGWKFLLRLSVLARFLLQLLRTRKRNVGGSSSQILHSGGITGQRR